MSARRKTDTVIIGGIPTGSDYPVRIQSMTNTLTSDIDTTVEQCIRIIQAGADYIRITVPSVADVENFREIKIRLRSKGYNTPLIADVHFNALIALKVAEIADKVRINPGNFGITGKFHKTDYSPEEFAKEFNRQREVFIDLLKKCKKNNTAIRIGVNHGSLSDRIVSRYGDTVEGMVESSMEFLRICQEENFTQVVISMKASNTRIMVYATRLLVKQMSKENMHYPLHLGVTEAGEGEDGRIKSAVGIGTLLNDGIGDTVRVSLTEDPEQEIPIASKIIRCSNEIIEKKSYLKISEFVNNPFSYEYRNSISVKHIGGNNLPVVIADEQQADKINDDKSTENRISVTNLPDFLYISSWNAGLSKFERNIIMPFFKWKEHLNIKNIYPLFTAKDILKINQLSSEINFLQISFAEICIDILKILKKNNNIVLILTALSDNIYADSGKLFKLLKDEDIRTPVILKVIINEKSKEDYQIKAAVNLGSFFIDGLANGIWLSGEGNGDSYEKCSTAFALLQATRARMSRTEYIACPSCGRTHFNLMEILAKIKSKTSHLKGLKIGVMGCIVNGPGEMADADYGYVGSGIGKVTLYKGKEIVKRNIPEEAALEELIKLIKQYGDWCDPE
jgi:(E)-4-hydroxy-3-methylbut-2-enyl-diphosphate synthase